MFSEKRGAELVLYKLKKTLPIGSGFCLLPIGRVFLCISKNVSISYSVGILTLSADCGLKRSVYVQLPLVGHQ